MKEVKIQVVIDQITHDQAKNLFPGQDISALLLQTFKKLVGEARLRAFAEVKKAEVEAEAQRLNREYGLSG